MLLGSDVTFHGDRIDFGGGILRRRAIDVGHDNAGAVGAQDPADFPSDALPRTRHRSDPPVQQRLRHRLSPIVNQISNLG
jgi:hypothetical protein